MTATQDDTIIELQRSIVELRRGSDAALAREVTLAKEPVQQAQALLK